MFQILKNKAKEFVKKYGLFHIYESENFALNREYKVAKKLKNKYVKKIYKKYEMPLKIEKSNKIWVCWFQGMENAPELIKSCYESVKRHFKDKEIVVITNENMNDYVQFPNYIIEKYEKGIISKTHLSDLLRLELLIRYGGIWIDATCFITNKLPTYIEDVNLFYFRDDYRGGSACKLSSWFIYSIPNHPILLHARELIYNYWEKENKLKHYFLFHLFITMVMNIYPDLVSEIPFVSNINPHVLQFEYLFKPFNNTTWDFIKNTCFIHKLSHKFDLSKHNLGDGLTFYEYIVDRRCE